MKTRHATRKYSTGVVAAPYALEIDGSEFDRLTIFFAPLGVGNVAISAKVLGGSALLDTITIAAPDIATTQVYQLDPSHEQILISSSAVDITGVVVSGHRVIA